MPRLFAGSRDISFLRSSPATVSVTTAGRFDPAFVSQGVVVNVGDLADTPPWYGGVASVTTIGVRMDIFPITVSTGPVFQLLNSAGVVVVEVRVSSTAITLFGWNGAALTQIGATNALSITSTLVKMCLNATAGAGGALALYIGDVLIISGTGFAQMNNFARLRLQGCNGAGASCTFSQVMVADFDLRDANMFSQVASANGANTGGTGAATDLSESPRNDSTRVLMATVGLKRTLVKPAVTVPTGKVIKALGANLIARQQGGVVTNAYGLRRFGGVDNRSALLGVAGAYEARGFIHDPGVLITQADYNATEIGFESA